MPKSIGDCTQLNPPDTPLITHSLTRDTLHSSLFTLGTLQHSIRSPTHSLTYSLTPPTMIKAAIYQASEPRGVALRSIPLPQLSGSVYTPNSGNLPKQIIMTALSLLATLLTTLLTVVRWVYPSVPGTYGEYKHRRMILCKVSVLLTHLLTHLLVHPFVHTLTHSLTHSLNH